jgi:calcineurin-like phosphoesterase family protein
VTQSVTQAATQTIPQTNHPDDATSSTATTSTSTGLSADAFSIFWITDTQFLSESNPALYRTMTKWIASNWASYNGKLVIHTGDIVEHGSEQQEWNNAESAMSILTEAGIPYCWCAGNHDDLVVGDASSGWMGRQWTSAFNPATMGPKMNALKYTSWVADYHDAMNTAVTFTAAGLNFLVVNVEWNGDSTTIRWLSDILSNPKYSNYHAIVAPHAYIDAWGLTNDPRWGITLGDFVTGFTSVIDQHTSNVFLTLNGHFGTDQGYNTPNPTNFRNMLMFDRQDCRDAPDSMVGRGVEDSTSVTPDGDKVGGATVTILTFDKTQNKVFAKTYDVYTGLWRRDANEEYSFKMFP